MAATTLADRAVIRLSGEDLRGFLQGLVTNDLDALAPGRPLWAGLLGAQGKVLFDFLLWEDGGDVLVDAEAEQADALVKRLALYRLRRPSPASRGSGTPSVPSGAQCTARPGSRSIRIDRRRR